MFWYTLPQDFSGARYAVLHVAVQTAGWAGCAMATFGKARCIAHMLCHSGHTAASLPWPRPLLHPSCTPFHPAAPTAGSQWQPWEPPVLTLPTYCDSSELSEEEQQVVAFANHP